MRKAIKSFSNRRTAANAHSNNHTKKDNRQRKRWYKDKDVWLVVGTFIASFTAVWQAKEVADQFTIANTPYLQFEYIYDSTTQGKRPKTAYKLVNLSTVPCKIRWIEISDSFDYHTTVVKPLLGKIDFSPYGNTVLPPNPKKIGINMYSTNNSPYQAIYYSQWTLDQYGVDSLIQLGQVSHYIFANVFYTNLVSHRAYIYQFAARIIHNPAGGLEMLQNENAPDE